MMITEMNNLLPESERNALEYLKIFVILTFLYELMGPMGSEKQEKSGWRYCYGPLMTKDYPTPEDGPIGPLLGKERHSEWRQQFEDTYNVYCSKCAAGLDETVAFVSQLTDLFPFGNIREALEALGKSGAVLLSEQLTTLWICAQLYTSVRRKSDPLSVIYHAHFNGAKGQELSWVQSAWARLYCYPFREERIQTLGSVQEAFELLQRGGITFEDYPRFFAEARQLGNSEKDSNALRLFLKRLSASAKQTDLYKQRFELVQQAVSLMKNIAPQDFLTAIEQRAGVVNDSGVEHGLVYQRAIRESTGDQVLVVNPSMLFLKKLQSGRGLGKKQFRFCFARKSVVDALGESTRYGSFEEVGSFLDEMAQPDILVFAHQLTRKQLLYVMESIQTAALARDSQNKVTVLLPTSFFDDKRDEGLRVLLTTRFRLLNVISIPKGSPGGKRLLLELKITQSPPSDGGSWVTKTNHVTLKGSQQYIQLDPPVWLAQVKLAKPGKTLNALLSQTEALDEPRQRNRPEPYCFSPEITLWCTCTRRGNGRYTVKLCFYDYPTGSQKQRNKLERGVLLTTVQKDVRYLSELPKIAEQMVFHQRMLPAITEAVSRYMDGRSPKTRARQSRTQVKRRGKDKRQGTTNPSETEEMKRSISLKSFWFVVRDRLQRTADKTGYDDGLCMRVFCHWHEQAKALSALMLPETKSGQFREALNDTASALELSEEDRDAFWEQLHLIAREAVEREYYVLNPIDEYQPKSAAPAGKDLRQLRDALVKKCFTPDEEMAVYNFLVSRLPGAPEALGGLIRLCTGMSIGEIAALQWRDLCLIMDSHYQLLVYKELRNGSTEPDVLNRENKYRRGCLWKKLRKYWIIEGITWRLTENRPS